MKFFYFYFFFRSFVGCKFCLKNFILIKKKKFIPFCCLLFYYLAMCWFIGDGRMVFWSHLVSLFLLLHWVLLLLFTDRSSTTATTTTKIKLTNSSSCCLCWCSSRLLCVCVGSSLWKIIKKKINLLCSVVVVLRLVLIIWFDSDLRKPVYSFSNPNAPWIEPEKFIHSTYWNNFNRCWWRVFCRSIYK